ncbi:MAG: methyl-accepting chemotaxis protein, partial [Desulfobacterales bacterium]|nr:methyl-accepting chemotaxis protein [Desulfobacterales bacterium]
NINDVSEKISDVNQSVAQGAEVASEIARDIVGVEEMSSRVQDESHTLNKGASDLEKMAEQFTGLMKQFKV